MKAAQQEIQQLRRAVTKLKAERDILTKAAANFAKDSIRGLPRLQSIELTWADEQMIQGSFARRTAGIVALRGPFVSRAAAFMSDQCAPHRRAPEAAQG